MERLWNPAQSLPTRRQWEARRKEQQELEVYSDAKVLLATELARAAEAAREKLKKDNVKLDIDPLKDIPEVEAQESMDDVRAALFQQWVGLNQVSQVTQQFPFTCPSDYLLWSV